MFVFIFCFGRAVNGHATSASASSPEEGGAAGDTGISNGHASPGGGDASSARLTSPRHALRKKSSRASSSKLLSAAAAGSHKVTEYFPIRRSDRKKKVEREKEFLAEVERQLLEISDDHLPIGMYLSHHLNNPLHGGGIIFLNE